MGGTNSYVACTWLPESNCQEKNCDLTRMLACRWDPKEYKFAIIGNIPCGFMTLFGLIMVHAQLLECGGRMLLGLSGS